MSKDLDTTAGRIAKLSAKDATTWREMVAAFATDAPHIFALLGSPMPSFQTLKSLWRAWRAKGTAWMLDTARMMISSPRAFLDARFENEKLKAMAAAWGMHLDFAPDIAGGALFPYLESMANQSLGMVIGAGGADTIIRAMVKTLECLAARSSPTPKLRGSGSKPARRPVSPWPMAASSRRAGR